MQTTGISATPSLNEWASFFCRLNEKKSGGQPFLTKDVTTKKMITHLEVKLPAIRKYTIGRQLKLFSN